MRCAAADALVIGYGNDLRADDGAGRCVADAMEARALPGVVVRSTSQLTPELALEMAGTTTVVFVDASIDDETVTVRLVESAPGASTTMTHHGDPATLLSMVAAVGTPPKEAYLVSIPASDLGLGFDFSPRTEAAVSEAIELVTELVVSRA